MEIVRVELPDIILSDLMMSEIDGLVLCRNIKGDMLTSHIPFIILSAKKYRRNPFGMLGCRSRFI